MKTPFFLLWKHFWWTDKLNLCIYLVNVCISVSAHTPHTHTHSLKELPDSLSLLTGNIRLDTEQLWHAHIWHAGPASWHHIHILLEWGMKEVNFSILKSCFLTGRLFSREGGVHNTWYLAWVHALKILSNVLHLAAGALVFHKHNTVIISYLNSTCTSIRAAVSARQPQRSICNAQELHNYHRNLHELLLKTVKYRDLFLSCVPYYLENCWDFAML